MSRQGDYERDAESGLLLPRHARRGIERTHPQIMCCGPVFFSGQQQVPDPSFSNNVLLLQNNGPEGSVEIVDSSADPKFLTVYGNTHLTKTPSIFGKSSIYFDGVGDYINFDPQISLRDGDFTAETWIHTSEASGCIFGRRYTNHGFLATVAVVGTELTVVWQQWDDGYPTYYLFVATATVAASAWVHVAWERVGNLVTGYAAGMPVGSVNSGYRPSAIGTEFHVGQDPGAPGTGFKGPLGPTRIKTGIALYMGPFTPPSASFPNY